MKPSAIKYLKIYWRLTKLSVMSQIEYRFNFFTEGFASFLDLILYLAFIEIIFNASSTVAGYTRFEIMLIYGLSIIARSLTNRLFFTNLREISMMANRGELDHFLTKPISTLFLISTHKFSFFTFFDTLLGVILTALALRGLELSLSVSDILLIAVSLILTAITFFHVILSFMSFSFWLGDINHSYWIYTALHGISRLPITAFQGFSRFIFQTLLPFILFGAVPAAIVLDRIEASTLLGILLSVLVWIIVGQFMWRKGLASYSSSGG